MNVSLLPLSVAPVDDEDGFATLTGKIAAESGFRCDQYKERCLRRRIAVRMRARGVHTYADYARLLDVDTREYERLLDALTINVTKLFRNWSTYDALARLVIPPLWERASSAGDITVWSAGCSSGEEAYSVAVLFAQHAETRRESSRLGAVRIIGSDIDRGSLEMAAAATYPEAAFADTPPALRNRYFTPGFPASVRRVAASLVRFERRDLLHDPPPAARMDLILCRNVLIYFDRATQERLFAVFRDLLAPEGYLVLGKVETLLGDARRGFVPLESRERIFQRS